MKEILKGVKNIVFDLGEVIVDLDFSATEEQFSTLLEMEPSEIFTYEEQTEVFNLLEVGGITPEVFRETLRERCQLNISDQAIDAAWNAMLLNIPAGKIQLVQNLRNTYQTFVLSNTNKIHIDCINENLLPQHNLESLEEVFDHVYYSHEIGERKPNAAAFQYILDKHEIIPSESLFIDDKLENIQTAASLGFKTWHLTNREDLYELA